jgi:hypothetical protein
MSMSKGGSVPQLRWSSVSLAASDRTDAAIAKPETPFVRVDELGDQISGNAWRAFHLDKKPASSARSASAASSIWRCRLRLLGEDEVCRDDRICRQSKWPKKRTRADSLMRGKISLIVRFNSLQGLKKFPVRMRRELAGKALVLCAFLLGLMHSRASNR